ncbi:MAG: hypothetical protein ACUVQH_07945 [Thermogutta sp.]
MRWIHATGLVGVVVASVLWASPFEWAPEGRVPWVSPFPYQRNVDLTFQISPVGGQPGQGIPGADYEGTADPVLKVSDFVEFQGNLTWYDSVNGFPFQGLIGIDNRLGNRPLRGGVVIHLGNLPSAGPEKRIWIEWDFLLSAPTIPVTFFVSDSLGNLPVEEWVSDIRPQQNGLMRQNRWYLLKPNPLWEEITIQFPLVPRGGYAFVDRFHIATECIPEPATGLIALAGGLGLIVMGIRRKRSGQPE